LNRLISENGLEYTINAIKAKPAAIL